MPIKRPNTGWMGQLAADKRLKTNQELEYMANIGSRIFLACQKELREKLNIDYVYLPELVAEHAFDIILQECNKLNYTESNFWYAQRKIVHKLYGDPQIMRQSSGHRPHARVYWNPTAQKVNIAPMGLVKQILPKTGETIIHEFVMPGDRIFIPDAYCTGGKYSTVAGVAPQLIPLPQRPDTELDVSPLTYTEWCTFGRAYNSPCCKKTVVWYDAGQRLTCPKCNLPC